MKKIFALLLSAALLVTLLAACGGGNTTDTDTDTQEPATDASTTQVEEQEPDTGDASKDDPLNQDEIGEKELLVVSFGTSYNDSRRETIGAIEKAMQTAFPDYSVRRAFTSQIIIDHVKDRDGVTIDNVEQALERAVNNGVKTLVVQPTHLMNGLEYEELTDELAKYSDSFEKIAIGDPLLTSDADFEAVMTAITDATDGKTAICFMGHGTTADSNSVYSKMQTLLTDKGFNDYYVGTVEATPSLDDVLAAVQKGSYEKVILRPLMIVAGDHANNDMAGDEDDSWKSTFEKAGYTVDCQVEGLGQLEAIQQLFVEHAKRRGRVSDTQYTGPLRPPGSPFGRPQFIEPTQVGGDQNEESTVPVSGGADGGLSVCLRQQRRAPACHRRKQNGRRPERHGRPPGDRRGHPRLCRRAQ